MFKIEIDPDSGFCFGVVNAITKAENHLQEGKKLYCIGDIVHNGQEIKRLSDLGLITIEHKDIESLKGEWILFRAHGEPPSSYLLAQQNGNSVIDASCPVVLNLQRKIKQAYLEYADAQIVIYGKIGHAEVNGLVGQTDGKAIVIETEDDLALIDFNRSIILFAQTTKSVQGFNNLVEKIKSNISQDVIFKSYDTICRQVANRIPRLREFASKFDKVLFVSGKKSSNGKVLFEECKSVNPNTYMVSDIEDIKLIPLKAGETIGICGATSTPKWLMESVAVYLQDISIGL